MEKKKFETGLTPEEEEILVGLRKKGRRTLIVNYILQALTLMTAIASLIVFFVDDSRGLDITINHIFQCVGALVVLNIPMLISRKFRCYIPAFITVTLYVFAFAHFVLGEIYRAYDHVFLYDKILHTTGGVIFAILSFSVIWLLNNSESKKIKLSPFFIVLFTFCFTMTVEYVWELVEFGVDRLFGANMQRWQDGITQLPDGSYVTSPAYGSGLKDTMTDMIMNVLGCLVVCIIAYVGMRRKPNWFINKVILTEKQFRRIVLEKRSETMVEVPQESSDAAEKHADAGAAAPESAEQHADDVAGVADESKTQGESK